MKYLCLIYDNEERLRNRAKPEVDAFHKEYMEFTDDLRAGTHLVAGEALHPVSSAATVRIRNGKTSTTDGPFAETKEQLGGFYLIEAGDLDDAISVAARIPSARYGSVEVRPVVDFSQAAQA
jgi:hypothetical protein